MARTQSSTHPDEIYRVVVTVEYAHGHVSSFIYGPYASVGTAKGVATSKASMFRLGLNVAEVTGRIEKAVTTWEEVT